ncbi:hypothetical protein EJ06DRAFT_500913, partial [Trichodelitschia bisporula]
MSSTSLPLRVGPPPPLAALFLIKFDVKIGYTIAWKRALDGITLDNTVEFKSLPSGLHHVQSDRVYFVHDAFAGLSAFAQRKASDAQRGAEFAAVGVLVRLNDGRVGRAWEHAAALERLVQRVISGEGVGELEEYWEGHKEEAAGEGEGEDENGVKPPRHSRALSAATVPDATLAPDHPVRSIRAYLDTFGPLVYPLWRAALLRKRILFMTAPPVRASCEYVYDLSILSSLPASLSPLLPQPTPPRLTPLFALGIHDIPLLSDPEMTSWAACSTDEILALKAGLYDLLVEMPPQRYVPSRTGRRRVWPVLKAAGTGARILATQRDWRAWKALREALGPAGGWDDRGEDQEGEEEPLLRARHGAEEED